MIPIKGYATFHPLKHCLVGRNFSPNFFLKNVGHKKAADALARIAEETEEDYLSLIDILKKANITTYRPDFNEDEYKNNFHGRPPISPRDHFAVIGKTFYATHKTNYYGNILKNISKENLFLQNWDYKSCLTTTANITRVGKDLFWDIKEENLRGKEFGLDKQKDIIDYLKKKWEDEGFRVHISSRGYHNDGVYCVVKPGVIVSLYDVQNYNDFFPNWEVLYLPDQGANAIRPFTNKWLNKVRGRWWVEGEEKNEELFKFVNSWLSEWVGYVEETVFDVNMLSIDENTIICNNYNKEVFDFFKKHKVEPIVFNFRHRFFWDGGVHCVTQDFYREGNMEDYFG